MERTRTSWPVQRRLSFQYRYDVQEQAGSVVLAGFGLQLTKKPLDLLNESFERSDDQSAPVSLIRLDQQDLPSSDQASGPFTIGQFFSRLKRRKSRVRQVAPRPSAINSQTVRLPPHPLRHRRPLPNLPSFHSRTPSFTPVHTQQKFFLLIHKRENTCAMGSRSIRKCRRR